MFEIHISDSNVSAGSIPVRWCFDRDSYEKFKGGKVVIIVAPVGTYEKSTKEKRFVVDVKDGEAYITFKYPGENRIFAYVYNPIHHAYTDHRQKVLERRFQSYSADIIDHQTDGGAWLPYMTKDFDSTRSEMGLKEFEIAKPFDVNVPDQVFGKEPSALERAWVTWLVDDDARDQCEFRKKRLFAYTLQLLLIFPANYLLRVFLHLLALLTGMRALNAQGLLHPLTTTITGSATSLFEKGTIFVRDDPKKFQGKENTPKTKLELLEYLTLKLWPVPFAPPIVVVIYLFTTCHVWHFLGLVALVIGAIVGLIGVFVSGTVAAGITWLWTKLMGNRIKARENELKTALLCGAPIKHKSLKLRYYATKSKVCKPFAG